MALSVKSSLGGGSIGSVENLFVPTGATQTIGNITCTANGDGTYTVNGTNGTSAVNFNVGTASVTSGVKMVGCPSGGGSDTYRLRASDNTVEYVDNGVGVNIETSGTYNIYINIRPNAVCDNLIFKPMLTTNLKATYKEFVKRVGGFNNLINITATNKTMNGITFTVNSDGTITANGTSTGNAYIEVTNQIFPNGIYKLSGCPKGGGDTTYQLNFSGINAFGIDFGNGVISNINNQTSENPLIIYVRSGVTLNNVTFKPMLTESLLPEYYDFVKGVAEGITPQMFGCTKMWSNTIVNASNRTLRNVGNFNHGLGVVPKVYAILIDDDSGSSASYMSICQLVGFYADATYHAHIHTCRYPNAFTGERTYSSTDSSVSATSISFSGTTTGYAGGQYLLAGHTYKFIVMA